MDLWRILTKEHFGRASELEDWVRPKSMFLETTKIDGKDVPRFKYVE